MGMYQNGGVSGREGRWSANAEHRWRPLDGRVGASEASKWRPAVPQIPVENSHDMTIVMYD